jgi:hypothetical protein
MPQVLTTEMAAPLKNKDEVRPYDKVKIYWTANTKHVKEGAEEEVHPLLAEKLIASGKATKEAPKDSKKAK